MQQMMRGFCISIALAWAVLFAGNAAACTTSTSTTDLGRHSSYALGTTAPTGSGSAGLQCNTVLAALTRHYVALRVDASTFQLAGPGGKAIPFTASLTPAGTPLTVGSFQDLSSLGLLSLFAGSNSSVPIYFRTAPTSGLRAGTYTGSIDLRWYYSVCSVGVLACLSYSSSPGFVRPLLGSPTWGSGVAVRVNVQLVVQNDCIITAPNATFGSAPLAGSFDPITRTILIRCSAGAEYTVGMDNGSNPDNGVRRMRNGSNYLRYEIYKSLTSPERWGGAGNARRSSAGAETNPGIYDSLTAQGFTYRAAILPGQATPPAGTYSDTIRIDVTF